MIRFGRSDIYCKHLRVLTFNSHQPYLHIMAEALPWAFGIITPRQSAGSEKKWDPGIRPLPSNARLYSSVREAMLADSWDWVLAHNVHDFLDTREIPLPKVFLVHGTLSGRILQDRSTIDRALYLKNLQFLLSANHAAIVFVSGLKRDDWGIPGEVIRLTVDPCWYGGYRGEVRGVLQVSNHLKERGLMTGWSTYQTVCRDIPNLLLGDNKTIPASRRTKDWDDLKEQLRSFRIYLYTPIYPYEDGYNTSLLEAMATGMPVATLKHPTSPVRDGCEGVVADSAEELRDRVLQLLDDPAEAARMGRNARIRVETEFSISEFRNSWQSFAERLLRGE
ncbi:MAG: glycosyltransferase family 4 protein [Acidobacteria bacterium]|nr:glycosyltransferase family 4 protein [Acidobacteriota bacterium]